MTKQRVLMITAAWPPVARVGARRPLRIARRLHSYGWTPVIMTPDPESVFRRLPAMDHSLQIPEVEVHHVPAWVPSTRIARTLARLPGPLSALGNRLLSAALFPDQYREWTHAARRAAVAIKDIDVVWVTGGPFGIFLSGAAIARDLGVPLVLDYRDPWTTGEDLPRSLVAPIFGGLHRLEASLLRQATGVAYVNADMRARNLEAFGKSDDASWQVIPNGFDPVDIGDAAPTHFEEPTIIYAGACYASRSMAPVLRALADADASGIGPCRLRIFGELDPAALDVLNTHPMPTRVSVSKRIPSAELTGHIKGAAALLLIIGEEHRTALSAKVFDYLQANRPVIGYGPSDSDAARLVTAAGVGHWASTPSELLEVLKTLTTEGLSFDPDPEVIQPYSADAMAEATAELLTGSHSRSGKKNGKVTS